MFASYLFVAGMIKLLHQKLIKLEFAWWSLGHYLLSVRDVPSLGIASDSTSRVTLHSY